MKLAVSGQGGSIKVGYQTAATLGPYSLTPVEPGIWQVKASVKTADAFWLSQSPRVIELVLDKQRWRWSAEGLMVVDGTVSGTVTGRPERR
jgi:hypothetical protein